MKKSQNHRGRLVHREERGIWVTWADRLRLFQIEEDFIAAPGDYIELVHINSSKDPWTCASLRILQSYTHPEPFPPQGSDWNRFHGNGGPSIEVVRKLAVLRSGVRAFFEQEEFIEVDTPAINISPGLEIHLDAIEARGRTVAGGPLRSQWLMTSPEYHMKRLLSADFEKIYQLCKAFRSGVVRIILSSMLEWYRSFSDWKTGPEDTRRLIAFLAEKLEIQTELPGIHHGIPLDAPWVWLTVQEAIESFVGFDPFPWEDGMRNRALAENAGISFSEQDCSPADILTRILVDGVEPHLPTDRFWS